MSFKVTIELKHVQKTSSGKRYRRRIPKGLQVDGASSWFLRPLGSTDVEVVRNHPVAERQYQKLLEDLKSFNQQYSSNSTPRQQHQALKKFLNSLGYSEDGYISEAEDAARMQEADRLLSGYSQDTTGDYMGVPEHVQQNVEALMGGVSQRLPEATFSDALVSYVETKGLREPSERSSLQRVERVASFVNDALGFDPDLRSLKRQDARSVVEFMQGDLEIAASTCRRYLNDLRAIFNHGCLELDVIRETPNPFVGLDPKDEEAKIDKRPSLSDAEIKAVGVQLQNSNGELRGIWRLLVGTGARRSEVTGLRVGDVRDYDGIPYIRIEPHTHRSLKTEASIRSVPLVGDALEAAREALMNNTSGSPAEAPLFPRYGSSKRGADAAGAMMNKTIKKALGKHSHDKVVHSLRHSMKDKLRIAGAPLEVQEGIAGRTTGGIGESYGSTEALLKVYQGWLEKAQLPPQVLNVPFSRDISSTLRDI